MSTPHQPRGHERLMYHADGGINIHNLWEPFSPDQLTGYIDAFADNGVDIFSQLTFAGGALKPGLFVPEHPEFAWWTYEKFRKMLDEGIQPMQIMIDRAHERGMKFFAKLRMSDWHRRSVEDSGFIGRHPELQNPSMIVRPALDFTHQAVRDYHLELIDELVRRFDVDGITLNYTRSWQCFPTEVGGSRYTLMTDFVRQARRKLDDYGQRKGRRIELCAITLPHLELCRRFGLDVRTWIGENLIDYICIGNTGTSDPNMDHTPWSELCADSNCRYFPIISIIKPQCRTRTLEPEHLRALARGMYDGRADGISLFNWVYYWSTGERVEIGYPASLAYLRELRDPAKLDDSMRHYLFRPQGSKWVTAEGEFRDDFRVVMPRRRGVRHEYPLRLPEDLEQTGAAHLFFKVIGLAPMSQEARRRVQGGLIDKWPQLTNVGWPDALEIDINDQVVPADRIRRTYRLNGQNEADGGQLEPFTLIWFDLSSPPIRRGLNQLGIRLLSTVETPLDETDTITIEQVDVTVMPRPLGEMSGKSDRT